MAWLVGSSMLHRLFDFIADPQLLRDVTVNFD